VCGIFPHGHFAAQGIFTQWQSRTESFEEVAARSSEADASSLAQEWLTSCMSWQHGLPGRLGPVAIRALDGFRCMRNSVSNTVLIVLHLKEQHHTKLNTEIGKHGWSQSSDMMGQLQMSRWRRWTSCFEKTRCDR